MKNLKNIINENQIESEEQLMARYNELLGIESGYCEEIIALLQAKRNYLQ